jgi:hypothetical protein
VFRLQTRLQYFSRMWPERCSRLSPEHCQPEYFSRMWPQYFSRMWPQHCSQTEYFSRMWPERCSRLPPEYTFRVCGLNTARVCRLNILFAYVASTLLAD